MNSYRKEDDVLLLLIRHIEGVTTCYEGTVIRKLLEKNATARQLWKDVQYTYEKENPHFFIPDKPLRSHHRWRGKLYRLLKMSITPALLIICGLGILYYHELIPLTFLSKENKMVANGTNEAPTLAMNGSFNLKADDGYFKLEHTTFDRDAGWSAIIVPKGGKNVKIELPDGTLVHIGPASRLCFPGSFGKQHREISLEGDAYFEVKSNPTSCFTVQTKHAKVMALGTTFNIESYNDNFSVSLMSGSILVEAKKQEEQITLKPGQSAILSQPEDKFSVTSFDPNVILSRFDGKYLLAGKTLEEICKVLSRAYDIDVVIDDKNEISHYHFSCLIQTTQPINTFLEDLTITSGIRHYFDRDGKLHLRK